MGYLRRNDVSAVMDCVRELYQAPASPDFPVRALVAASKLVPSDASVLSLLDFSRQKGMVVTFPFGLFDISSMPTFFRYAHNHPVFRPQALRFLPIPPAERGKYRVNPRVLRTMAAGRALRVTDIQPVSAFRRTGMYNELFKTVGADYQLGASFLYTPTHAHSVGYIRKRRDFSEQERQMHDLMAPHFRQAFDIFLRYSPSADADDIDFIGTSAVGKGGFIRSNTQKAESLLRAYFPHHRPSNRLPEALRRWCASITDNCPRDGYPPAISPFIADRSGGRLTVRIGTLKVDGEVIMHLEETPHIPPVPRGSACAVDLTGLTPREGEVLHWVAQGKTNDEIAIILGMATRTVKKHLERIFQKLGVENRTSAALMVMEMNSAGK